MRLAAPGLLFLALASSGCCSTRIELVGPSWDSPEQAYRTFRAAVLTDDPDLVHQSLSPAFRRRYGVPDIRTFVLGYAALRDEIADLKRALRVAERKGEVEYGRDPGTGWNVARVRVAAGGYEGSFLLVEIPTVHVLTEIPGYPPDSDDFFASGPGFSGNPDFDLAVRDGRVVAEVDADALGVVDADEVRELRFHRQWLLLDVLDLPVDVGRIVKALRRSGGGASP